MKDTEMKQIRSKIREYSEDLENLRAKEGLSFPEMADEINLSCLDLIDIPTLNISSLKYLNLSYNRIKDAKQIVHLVTLEELN